VCVCVFVSVHTCELAGETKEEELLKILLSATHGTISLPTYR